MPEVSLLSLSEGQPCLRAGASFSFSTLRSRRAGYNEAYQHDNHSFSRLLDPTRLHCLEHKGWARSIQLVKSEALYPTPLGTASHQAQLRSRDIVFCVDFAWVSAAFLDCARLGSN